MDLTNSNTMNQSAIHKMPDLVTNFIRNMWGGIRENISIRSLPGETWADCVGCFGLIRVSSFMRVKHVAKNIILKQIVNGDGYWQIRFTNGGRRVGKRVHRLYAEAFMRNPLNKPCVNHKNLITTDNVPLNLEWCTVLENTLHAKINGAIPVGTNVKHSKLTEEQVLGIYNSSKSYRAISKEYGIAGRMVAKIKNGTNWTSITKHTEDGFNRYSKANFN